MNKKNFLLLSVLFFSLYSCSQNSNVLNAIVQDSSNISESVEDNRPLNIYQGMDEKELKSVIAKFDYTYGVSHYFFSDNYYNYVIKINNQNSLEDGFVEKVFYCDIVYPTLEIIDEIESDLTYYDVVKKIGLPERFGATGRVSLVFKIKDTYKKCMIFFYLDFDSKEYLSQDKHYMNY